MLNKVQIIGHLGRDPEIRHSQSGDRIANFTVATSERWRDKQSGERKEKTEWHRVVCFNDRLSDVIEKYLGKGSKVYVEGSLQTRSWEKDGAKQYTTEIVLTKFKGEIVMLGDKGERDEDDDEPAPANTEARKDRSGRDLDDEIPF